MRRIYIFSILILAIAVVIGCKKEDPTDAYFDLLTAHIWTADSLLADGVEAGGDGQLLERFNGDTKFNTDGTGYVGEIAGLWEFTETKTSLIITSDSLPASVQASIAELTSLSLKLTTAFPVLVDSTYVPVAVRMCFVPK
jgi:hypothetical protein